MLYPDANKVCWFKVLNISFSPSRGNAINKNKNDDDDFGGEFGSSLFVLTFFA